MGCWAATANAVREMTRLHICLAVAFYPLRHSPCFCIFGLCLWGLIFLKISISRLPDARTHTCTSHAHTPLVSADEGCFTHRGWGGWARHTGTQTARPYFSLSRSLSRFLALALTRSDPSWKLARTVVLK